MKLNQLINLINENSLISHVCFPPYVEDNNPEIYKLVSDSRKAKPGTIFACVVGEHFDGHDYAKAAIASGASALLCERELELNVPQIICSDIRRNMGIVSSLIYETPIDKLTMIGLTGTNGKTTTTFMLKSILKNAGMKTGLLGTIYYDDGNVVVDAEQTTPEASDLQYWLARMVKNKCEACIMEVSSHAIVQGRIEGVLYDRVGFSNLTVDHLDYHEDMEQYFLAKKKLFDSYVRNNWKAAVNVDDEYGKRLIKEFCGRVVTFGTKDKSADFLAVINNMSINGMEVGIKTPNNEKLIQIQLPVLGDYNIHNALEALAIAWTLNIDDEVALKGLVNMKQIPGRLERYIIQDKGSCVIDFAHSPDSLEKVLVTLRAVCKGKLHVVFGAGGDRDKTKRPIMGELATKLADKVIITSDNPRSEKPSEITSEIEVGAKKYSDNYRVVVDRREAIAEGLKGIADNDVLLIAGRGPERFQIVKEGPLPFLDKDVVFDWCAKNKIEVH